MLSRFRISHTAIRDAILHIDDQRLSLDNLKSLRQYAPTVDEIDAIASFTGDVSKLAVADRFYREVRCSREHEQRRP